MRGWSCVRLGLAIVAVATSGCDTSQMGALEALDTLGEVDRSARGEQATADVIDISTDFTIGGALADAARTIADFWESQAPCTTVTLDGATATIDYGALDDGCEWNGHTYEGVNTVSVSSTTPGELEVDHTWAGFSDGEIDLDGEAVVTWSGEDLTRRVVTDHTFTERSTGETVDVTGDHVTGRIDPSVPVWQSGFTLDGTREWSTDRGDASVVMTDLELMLLDPAPQAGQLEVVAYSGRSLTIVYDRVDEDTISATLQGLRGGDRVFHISRLGVVSEAD